jgi:hypothetical protein
MNIDHLDCFRTYRTIKLIARPIIPKLTAPMIGSDSRPTVKHSEGNCQPRLNSSGVRLGLGLITAKDSEIDLYPDHSVWFGEVLHAPLPLFVQRCEYRK